jgi:hypothetical protein
MAHWAIIKEDNLVSNIIVISNEDITNENGEEDEILGYEKCKEIMGEDHRDEYKYVQCSYNGRIRGKYPGIGDTYDESLDAFIPPKPLDYMIFDESTWNWVPPNRPTETSQMISDEVEYQWNYNSMKWELVPTKPLDYSLKSEWETMSKEERMSHYYRWDPDIYLQSGDYLGSFIKTQIPSDQIPSE